MPKTLPGLLSMSVARVAALFVGTSPAVAQPSVSSEIFSRGLDNPLFLSHAPGIEDRLFVVEQGGQGRADIRTVDRSTGSIDPTPFLRITSGISTGGERGLLGLAFHPDYATNGYLFISYTNSSGDSVIQRMTALGDPVTATAVDPESAVPVLSIDQPQSNHNGGWIDFGPDGFLYISSGDGGGAGDPQGFGQNLDTLLGKMLRIDVNSDDFPQDPNRNYAIPAANPFANDNDPATRAEIWAFGLRNPWRSSFDRATGDLYIADVGQNAREEVNVQLADSLGGENYGWRCREGNTDFTTTNCPDSADLTEPIHVYAHGNRPCASITGGYVYRGCAIPSLQGWYVFGDYCTGEVWALTTDGTTRTGIRNLTTELNLPQFQLVSFGEDQDGELYLCLSGSGEIRKLLPQTPVDLNGNGVQDSCEPGCEADLNTDGVLDTGDINFFVQAFVVQDPAADANGDGIVDNGDAIAFVQAFLLGCS